MDKTNKKIFLYFLVVFSIAGFIVLFISSITKYGFFKATLLETLNYLTTLLIAFYLYFLQSRSSLKRKYTLENLQHFVSFVENFTLSSDDSKKNLYNMKRLDQLRTLSFKHINEKKEFNGRIAAVDNYISELKNQHSLFLEDSGSYDEIKPYIASLSSDLAFLLETIMYDIF